MCGMRAVGDLDGDGFDDYLLYERSSREYANPLLYLSDTWETVDIAAGWRIAWAAAGGDLDGDGLDDLVLGRIEPQGGARQLSTYSQAGLIEVRTVHADEPAWGEACKARVGRFHGDGPWYVLLAIPPERYFNTSGTVAIVPGV